MAKTLTKSLPKCPGVYLFKDKNQQVLYVGKAKSIQKRVASYFQKQHSDWKISALLQEHDDIDFIATKTETEAMLLEATLIKNHKPKYNVLLKDGQPFLYILFTQKTMPRIMIVRNKKEKGDYFGPFLQKAAARKAYAYLVKTFRLQTCNKKIDQGCLDYHLGICAGTCKKDFNKADYSFRLELAMDALKNSHKEFAQKIKNKIAEYAKELAFEKAKHLAEYLGNIDTIFNTLHVKFSEKKFEPAVFIATSPINLPKQNYDDIAATLQERLHLTKAPVTIDCFDVSHFQGSYLVGACIRFTRGSPDKNNFRRFKIKTLTEQNDYAALQEIVSRRYKDPLNVPDLIVIDGGKGQLNSVSPLITTADIISLAKREELVFSSNLPHGLPLHINDPVGQLIIALRDYAHHFAISYHRNRRNHGSFH